MNIDDNSGISNAIINRKICINPIVESYEEIYI